MHTLYTPGGWGREVVRAMREALCLVFERYDMVVTYVREDNRRTRPPRAWGFKQNAPPFDYDGVKWSLWSVDKEGFRCPQH